MMPTNGQTLVSAANRSLTAPRGRRMLWPWYAAELAVSFSVILAGTNVYYFARYALHAPAADLLWIAAGGGFTYMLGAFFGGRWVDRLGQRRVLQALALLNIPVFAVAVTGVLLGSLTLLMLHVALLNLFSAAMWPALESALTRSPGRWRLTTRVTVYNLTWSTGAFLAFGADGTLALWFSWAGVFLGSALVMLLSWAMVRWWAIPQSWIGAEHVADDPRDQQESERVMRSAPSLALLHMAWLANMLAFVCTNTVIPLMPAITLADGLRSYAVATAVGSIWTWMRALGFALAWLWTGWHYRVRWMLLFFGVLIVATEGLLLGRGLLALIGLQIIFGLAAAMLYSGSLYYSMHLGRGGGRNAGIHEALIGGGTVVGPALAALAGPPDNLPSKAVAILLVLLCGALGMGLLAFRTRGLPVDSAAEAARQPAGRAESEPW